jgi:hypothetical protein
MRIVKSTWTILLAGAGLLLGSALAKADSITLTLSSPFQNGGWGSVLEFDATVTNTTASTVYLNDDDPTILGNPASPPMLVLDDSGFFNNFPLSLAPSGSSGDTFTGELFTVAIQPGVPYGIYAGTFEILGGNPSDFADMIGSANFGVTVTPEPPSWQLLAMALMCLFAVIFRNSRRRQTVL